MTIYIFAGPTISAEEVRAEIEAVYLPPAEQGDIFRAALRGPRAIGIVDGYFHHRPAVWHKEILWAMSQGIHVYGSASMGALRAAELAPFGMVGVGEIFTAFRDGSLEDDDEVAVAHGLAETGYRAVSEAMVNIRATLDRAVVQGIVSNSTRATILEIAKSLFYAERSYALALQRAAEAGVPPAELSSLRDWLRDNAINQKKLDALAMLRRIRGDAGDRSAPKQIFYQMEDTDFWQSAMRSATQAQAPGSHSTDLTTTAIRPDRVLEELRLSGVPYLEARDRALLRDLALIEAQRNGRQPGEESIRRHTEHLRKRHGLHDPAGFERWLSANGISESRFAALAREEAMLSKVVEEQDIWNALLDHLRVGGRYLDLQRRADEKEQMLRAAGQDDPTLSDVGVTREQLAKWYFARLGPMFQPDFARHTQSLGFDREDDLVHAALREYCYVKLKERERASRA